MNSIFAKRIRSTIESAKKDLDLARQQRTTSATLRQCNIVNAIQVTKAFVEAVDSGVRLPGEIVASVVFSRPMSDIDAINWWLFLAEELRKAFPNRIKGSSGKLDYPRYIKNEHGELMGCDGKPSKLVKTKHKGPDGKTYFGVKRTGEIATDRDNMDEAMLLEVERRIATDWSDLFRLLSEAIDEHEPNKLLAGGDEAESGQSEADGRRATGKKSDHIERRVARLESKIEKPLRSDQTFVQQRLRFCCPRRTKTHHDSWSKIYNDYNAKFPKDEKASPDTLRLTHSRNCPKCKNPSGH